MEKAVLQFDPGKLATTPSQRSLTGNAIAPSGVIVLLDTSNLPTNLSSEAALFVYLRQPGQTMPLAVEHFKLDAIPSSVSFQFENPASGLELVARLSLSGQVNPSPEDIQVIRTVDLTHPMKTLSISLPATATIPKPEAQIAAGIESVTIKLSYAGTPEVAPESPVFVVAHSPGTRMPRAAKKLTFADLPLTLKLTDSDSMVATNKLSAAAAINVRAHIATGGSPSPVPGDWLASSTTPDSEGTYVLQIDRQLHSQTRQ